MASHTPNSDKEPAIIAVMGVTGVGKSTFINTATKRNTFRVSDGVDSCTKQVQEARLKLRNNETEVVLVDTPGFDDSDTSMSDTDVLRLIAKYLVTSHKAGTKLTGVVFMHRITDEKVGGCSRRYMKMFQELCGSKHLRQVVLLTTRWDEADPIVAERREKQIREGETMFKPMIAHGAKMMRHHGNFQTAQVVLEHLLSLNTMVLNIQTQLVKEKMPLPVTDAGSVINHDLMREARRCQTRLAEVKEELEKAKDPATKQALEEERRELQEEKKAVRKQIKSLSKNLNERFVLWRLLSAMGF